MAFSLSACRMKQIETLMQRLRNIQFAYKMHLWPITPTNKHRSQVLRRNQTSNQSFFQKGDRTIKKTLRGLF
jgi:hypothetical protein